MFNIKRLINNIQDKDKSKESLSSPSKSAEESQNQELGAEGFLCPTCMLAFPSPDSLQVHYESTHIDGASAKVDLDENNTLLCPACKMRFSSENMLQSHYNVHHSVELQGDKGTDLKSLKMEVAELKTSLKEEQWHSGELKKEVDRLQASVTEKLDSNGAQAELDMLRQQSGALEESKRLLTSEIVLLRQQLSESMETNSELKSQKDRLEQRSASISAESADAKSKLDEEAGNKAALEHHIHELQNEVMDLASKLSERPSEDDVAVLKQELVSVQMLMDQLAQQGEEDKLKLESELSRQQTRYNEVESERKNLQQRLEAAPRPEDIETLRDIISQGSSSSEKLQVGLQEKEKAISDLKLKLQKAEYDLSERIKLCDELSEAHDNHRELAKSRLQSNEELELELNKRQHEIVELKTVISENRSQSSRLKDQVEKLETDLKESRDSSQGLLVEKEHSYNHLKIEFDRVQGLFKNKESEIGDLNEEVENVKKHYQEMCALNEEYKNQIREEEIRQEQERENKMTELSEAEHDDKEETIFKLEHEMSKLNAKVKSDQLSFADAKIKLESDVKDSKKRVESLQEKITALDCDAKDKAEQLLAAEEKRASLKVELENQVTGAMNSLKDKTKECDKISMKLDYAQAEIASKSEEIEILKLDVNDVKYKLKLEENKCSSLDARIGEQAKSLESFTASASGMKDLLKEKSEVVAKLEISIAEEKENHKVAKLLSDEAKNNLEMQLKQQTDLKDSLSNRIAELTGFLSDAKNEAAALQASVADNLRFHQREKEELIQVKSADESRFQTEKAELKNKMMYLENESDNSQKILRDEKLEHEKLKVQFNHLSSELSSITAKCNAQESELKETLEELCDLKELKAKASSDFEQLSLKHDELTTLFQNLEAKGHAAEAQNKSLRDELETFRSDHESIVSELEKEKLLCSDAKECSTRLENELKEANDRLAEKDDTEDQLNIAIQDLTGVKVEMSATILKLDEELKTENQNLKEVTELKNNYEKELTEKRITLAELRDTHSSTLIDLEDLKTKFEKHRSETAEEATALKTRTEILSNQKIECQGKMSNLEEQMKEMTEKHKKEVVNLKDELVATSSELKELKSKLDEGTSAYKRVLQLKDENETKYEMQLEALTDNLSTLRADHVSEQAKNEELEKRIDQLTGEKLELDAKLENALDERRALLKRCVDSETEYDRLRVASADLKKKYDESVAATHELGRENQTLQMEMQKILSRKWADDSEVQSCHLCHNAFTVTNRKHHCRKCGNIYCNDCTTKQTNLPSSKKAVRVCDTCYKDATNH